VNRKRLIGAAIGTAGAVGIGAAVAARRYAVGRARWRVDPDAGEPFGELRGYATTVEATDGVPLYVEVDGPDDAPLTVVFCHGYCLNQDSWHYQRRDLDDGLRKVFWDQRGHGRSGRGDIARATIDQCGDDLLAVLRATAVGPVVLVGHSMGAMTIMALAERHPELFGDLVAGVALINSSSGELAELTFGLPAVLGKVVKRALPGVVSGLGRQARLVDRGRRVGADLAFVLTRRIAFADPEVSPTVVDFLERMIRSTPIDVIAEFYPTFAAHDKLAALEVLRRVPALVIVGDQDRVTPPAHGRAIAAALPDAELVEIAGGGHVVILEHPGVVTEALAELIERVLPLARERTA
jgi:pimeloyl-ACP methyl ester carboxylesterase